MGKTVALTITDLAPQTEWLRCRLNGILAIGHKLRTEDIPLIPPQLFPSQIARAHAFGSKEHGLVYSTWYEDAVLPFAPCGGKADRAMSDGIVRGVLNVIASSFTSRLQDQSFIFANDSGDRVEITAPAGTGMFVLRPIPQDEFDSGINAPDPWSLISPVAAVHFEAANSVAKRTRLVIRPTGTGVTPKWLTDPLE